MLGTKVLKLKSRDILCRGGNMIGIRQTSFSITQFPDIPSHKNQLSTVVIIVVNEHSFFILFCALGN